MNSKEQLATANGNVSGLEPETVKISSKPLVVSILGTGEFGRALGRKIFESCPKSAVRVVFGSRNPSGEEIRFVDQDPPVEVFAHEDAILKSDVVVVAVPLGAQSQLPLDRLTKSQIVIDISNSSRRKNLSETSNAEILQSLCGAIPVVKAFNVLSAYALSMKDPGVHVIPIASDSQPAKEVVSDLVQKMGFFPEDRGSLLMARQIEDIPQQRFDSWHLPLIISAFIWFFFLFFVVIRTFCYEKVGMLWDANEAIRVLRFVNKTCDNHALALLAICYLPGVLAAYIQLYRGTKYSRFPNWLDRWMRMRKQFGLLMLMSASVHACAYLLTFHAKRVTVKVPIWEPNENGTLYLKDTVEIETTEKKENLLYNAYLLAGVIGFGSAVVLGIVSLPSVAKSLSWQEFRLIQSRLGWFCLVTCTLHCVFKGWAGIISFSCGAIPSATQLPLYAPAITILLKLPLLIPFVDNRLTKIRAGTIQRRK